MPLLLLGFVSVSRAESQYEIRITHADENWQENDFPLRLKLQPLDAPEHLDAKLTEIPVEWQDDLANRLVIPLNLEEISFPEEFFEGKGLKLELRVRGSSGYFSVIQPKEGIVGNDHVQRRESLRFVEVVVKNATTEEAPGGDGPEIVTVRKADTAQEPGGAETDDAAPAHLQIQGWAAHKLKPEMVDIEIRGREGDGLMLRELVPDDAGGVFLSEEQVAKLQGWGPLTMEIWADSGEEGVVSIFRQNYDSAAELLGPKALRIFWKDDFAVSGPNSEFVPGARLTINGQEIPIDDRGIATYWPGQVIAPPDELLPASRLHLELTLEDGSRITERSTLAKMPDALLIPADVESSPKGILLTTDQGRRAFNGRLEVKYGDNFRKYPLERGRAVINLEDFNGLTPDMNLTLRAIDRKTGNVLREMEVAFREIPKEWQIDQAPASSGDEKVDSEVVERSPVFFRFTGETPGPLEIGYNKGGAAEGEEIISLGVTDKGLLSAELPVDPGEYQIFCRQAGEEWAALEKIFKIRENPVYEFGSIAERSGTAHLQVDVMTETVPVAPNGARVSLSITCADETVYHGQVSPGLSEIQFNVHPDKWQTGPVTIATTLEGYEALGDISAKSFENGPAFEEWLAGQEKSQLLLGFRKEVAEGARGLCILLSGTFRWPHYADIRNFIAETVIERKEKGEPPFEGPLLLGVTGTEYYDLFPVEKLNSDDFDFVSAILTGFRDIAATEPFVSPKEVLAVFQREEKDDFIRKLQSYPAWDVYFVAPHNLAYSPTRTPEAEEVEAWQTCLSELNVRLNIIQEAGALRYYSVLDEQLEQVRATPVMAREEAEGEDFLKGEQTLLKLKDYLLKILMKRETWKEL